MSDLLSRDWVVFIVLATVIGLLACLVLLLVAARRRVMGEDNSTGHVWDEDLRELNNPLPRWWMGLFVLTIAFAGVYLALYPGLALRTEPQWSSAAEHDAQRAQAQAAAAPLFAAYAAVPVPELARQPQAMDMGERLFANHCATCHGADARGSKGFPNLTDADWLWGGAPERIEESITQGRQGVMPPMAAAVGNAEDVRDVANYVLSLSGSPHNLISAQLGRDKFGACAPCHGPGGKGNAALGVPNLSDEVWLHGWGEGAITAMVTRGKVNVMPAHGERLSAAQIHILAAYVWGLSHRTSTP